MTGVVGCGVCKGCRVAVGILWVGSGDGVEMAATAGGRVVAGTVRLYIYSTLFLIWVCKLFYRLAWLLCC